MPFCEYKRQKIVKICAGDLNKQIVVVTRQIKPPEDDGIDYAETFTVREMFWAMVETVRGETVFDGNNVEQVVTHKFYIRYVPDLTFENWVIFEDRRYRLIDVSDFNERHEFYVLRCNLRGDVAVPVTAN